MLVVLLANIGWTVVGVVQVEEWHPVDGVRACDLVLAGVQGDSQTGSFPRPARDSPCGYRPPILFPNENCKESVVVYVISLIISAVVNTRAGMENGELC